MHKFVALCSLVAVAGCASKPTVMPALSKTADIVRPSVAETAAVNDATITSLEAATMQMAGAVVAQSNKAFVKQAESVALRDTQLASAPVLLDTTPPQTAAPKK